MTMHPQCNSLTFCSLVWDAMSGGATQKLICACALLSLLHAAYSAAQHRSYLRCVVEIIGLSMPLFDRRLVNQEFTSLPLDITVQTIVSLLVAIYAATNIAGSFQPVRQNVQRCIQSWDTIGNCPSFYTFEHRAKSLSPYFATADTHAPIHG